MKFLGKYSNGWGHLIVTLASFAFCLVLSLTSQDATIKGLTVSVVTLLVGYWFGAGRSSHELHEQQKQDEAKKQQEQEEAKKP